MKRKMRAIVLSTLLLAAAMVGCGAKNSTPLPSDIANTDHSSFEDVPKEEIMEISLTSDIQKLDENFLAVQYDKDYGFDDFLDQGGASSDAGVIKYLTDNILFGSGLGFLGNIFGCSTIASKDANDNALFGRNFDWENCEAMVVVSKPETDYASISTVNMDFITQGAGGMINTALKLDYVRTIAALYAPLDGMNEKGFAVSVNMIEDSVSIEQNTDKPDITTTTAIRLLLNKAANVEEALKLLNEYDLHASMGMMVHFALTDINGHSVVVEYIDNEMVVTKTPVVTNFYISESDKYGIGSSQSHERFEILMERLSESDTMSVESMRDALDRVSKDNFDDFASTEWSIVFNLSTRETWYYHRENYKKSYHFTL